MNRPVPTPPHVADNELIRSLVGSTLHGTGNPGQEDTDYMGVCVEPWEAVLGLGRWDQWDWRSQPDGTRSGPDDIDITVYGLGKYLRLATKGNPSVLLLLFVPAEHLVVQTEWGEMLQALAPAIVSVQAAGPFMGYCKSQRERMEGVRGGRHTNRPELVGEHGYDCYLDDTEFLTRRGWLPYDDVLDGEQLATYSALTDRIEWQTPTARVKKPYSGPIVFSPRGKTAGWAVTPNHRMFVSPVVRGASGILGTGYRPEVADWRFTRADSLTERRLWHARLAPGAGFTVEPFDVSDAYLSLLGAFVSEGCVGKRTVAGEPTVLRFEQKDGGRLHAVMAEIATEWTLRSYRYPDKRPVTTWTLADRDTARRVVKDAGEGSRHKRLPPWIVSLNTRQARTLLGAMIAGDGTFHRSGGWVYYTTSEALADDVMVLALAAGWHPTKWGPYTAGMFQVRIRKATTATIDSLPLTTELVEDRHIACFTVPNETLVTRRNGNVAIHGNTKYAMHALRLAYQGQEILNTGRITLPIPEKEGDILRAVRRGEVAYDDFMSLLLVEEWRLRQAAARSTLPERPDLDRVNAFCRDARLSFWNGAQGAEQTKNLEELFATDIAIWLRVHADENWTAEGAAVRGLAQRLIRVVGGAS